jgi:hypothetical protein
MDGKLKKVNKKISPPILLKKFLTGNPRKPDEEISKLKTILAQSEISRQGGG